MKAKNGTVSVPGSSMEYIRFGSGERILVLLPGLGDGLRTVKGSALPMGLMYRIFGKEFTVYGFSRRNDLTPPQSTRDMAADVAAAMDALGIKKADVLGVSMGGMIAQFLAIDHPQKVGRLVLAVTCGRPNPILTDAVEEWVAAAKAGDHSALMDSNLRRIYSDAYYRKNKRLIPAIGRLTKPDSYDRFFLHAEACLNHDAFSLLPAIQSPTLVIGGEQDKSLGVEASRELAARISGAKLKIYPQWGHGVYEEEPEFNRLVLDFLTEI